jgi:hypothetical protein
MTDKECEEFFLLLDNYEAQLKSKSSVQHDTLAGHDNVQINKGSQDPPSVIPTPVETHGMNVPGHSPPMEDKTEIDTPLYDKTREAIYRPQSISACTVSVKVENTIIEAVLDTTDGVTVISDSIYRSLAKQAPVLNDAQSPGVDTDWSTIRFSVGQVAATVMGVAQIPILSKHQSCSIWTVLCLRRGMEYQGKGYRQIRGAFLV